MMTRLGPFVAGRSTFTVSTRSAWLAERVVALLTDLEVGPGTSALLDHVVDLVVDTVPGAARSHPWALHRDGEPCETSVASWYVEQYLVWEITRLAIECSGELLPVHAAAVEWGGGAVLFPGVSHSGKSTLAGWLTHRGWGYLSDELALVGAADDGSLRVVPFPRPIGVRSGPLAELLGRLAIVAPPVGQGEAQMVPGSRLGRLGASTPVVAVVFPERSPTGITSLEPVNQARACVELVGHVPTLRSAGTTRFEAVVGMIRGVPCFRLRSGDLDESHRQLVETMERSHPFGSGSIREVA